MSVETYPGQKGPLARITSMICRRAFSSPEAAGYEVLISAAVHEVLAPLFDAAIRGQRILDVGCGGGRLAEHLVRRRALEVVGVDPSRSQAQRVARRGVQTLMASAMALPFRSGSFDSVVSSCAFKHFPDPTVGLRECARVLRPNGRLVIAEIDGAGTVTEVRRFAGLTRIPPGLRRAYTRFAMRTVVDVAPSAAELATAVANAAFDDVILTAFEGLPFCVVAADAASPVL